MMFYSVIPYPFGSNREMFYIVKSYQFGNIRKAVWDLTPLGASGKTLSSGLTGSGGAVRASCAPAVPAAATAVLSAAAIASTAPAEVVFATAGALRPSLAELRVATVNDFSEASVFSTGTHVISLALWCEPLDTGNCRRSSAPWIVFSAGDNIGICLAFWIKRKTYKHTLLMTACNKFEMGVGRRG